MFSKITEILGVKGVVDFPLGEPSNVIKIYITYYDGNFWG